MLNVTGLRCPCGHQARRTHTRSGAPEELRRAPENYVELPKDDKDMLKFLRMCEAARGGPQDGRQIQCDQDPTCVQCIPGYKMVSEEAPFTPVSSLILSFKP